VGSCRDIKKHIEFLCADHCIQKADFHKAEQLLTILTRENVQWQLLQELKSNM